MLTTERLFTRIGGGVPMLSGNVLVVAGPTASGKSALAMCLAAELGGEIINADSMQVYRDLRTITARPTLADESMVPHHLYGMIDASEWFSVGKWRGLAVAAIDDCLARGRVPIVVGGTGFYVEVLLDGISPIPDVSPELLLRLAREAPGAALFDRLVLADPESARRIGPTDRQRLARALAVTETTGRAFSSWQSEPREPLPYPWSGYWLNPPRERLYARCDQRLEQMMKADGLAEVEALAQRHLDPALPAMKALGVPEFRAYLAGERSWEAALQAAQQSTRRFAKRQLTWFRNRFGKAKRIDEQFSESVFREILSNIRLRC